MDNNRKDKLIDAARKYIDLGFSVIPVNTNKKPFISWEKFQNRKSTLEEIYEWYDKWPDANIAILTGKISGICVVDFDTIQAYEDAKDRGLPESPLVETNRGFHSYFKYRQGLYSFQKRDDLPNVELKVDGRYVVAPPSIHENGKEYVWCPGKSLYDLELVDLPEYFSAKDIAKKVPLVDLCQGVEDGERNVSLTRLVGSWASKGFDYDQCFSLALDWDKQNKPPLLSKEVEEVVKSIYFRHSKSSIPKIEETSFKVLEDGRLAEMIFDKKTGKTGFAVYNKSNNEISIVSSLLDRNQEVVPFQNDELITSSSPSVLLPSKAEKYTSEKELFNEIKSFIHRYVDLDDVFETIATLYVLFSWIYDCYTVLPYLRTLGDFGTGKSRFLYTIGCVCYKPMILVAVMGDAPLFRIIQKYRGTLVLDEASFKDSDTSTAIMQILNAGYEKKASVIRCVGKDHDIKTFQVYSPKIISSRERWNDSALESRCLTWMSSTSKRIQTIGGDIKRDAIPLYLGDSFDQEALMLRNQLLMFRFRNYNQKNVDTTKFKVDVEPRIAQILLPLLSMTQDKDVINEINIMARKMNKDRIEGRSMQVEARILQAIKDIEDSRTEKKIKIYLKEIAQKCNVEVEKNNEISTQTISCCLRKPELMIELEKKDKNGKSIICREEKMNTLYIKYGVIE